MKALEISSDQEKGKKDVQVKMEAQFYSESTSRPPGPVISKIVAQATNGFRFRRSTYAWKAKKITYRMPLV